METASDPAIPQTVVWIDHQQARIFILTPGKQNKTVIPSEYRGRTPGR